MIHFSFSFKKIKITNNGDIVLVVCDKNNIIENLRNELKNSFDFIERKHFNDKNKLFIVLGYLKYIPTDEQLNIIKNILIYQKNFEIILNQLHILKFNNRTLKENEFKIKYCINF